MSDAVTEAPVPVAGRRSRRRRRRSSGGRKVWIVLGGIVVVLAGLFFGVKIWIRNYLQSDKFRVWISGELSTRLDAAVQLDSIRWQDSTASVGNLTATGSPGGPFAKLEVRDIRAMVNAGAVWDRVWQVDEIKVARVFADLSSTGPHPADQPDNSPAAQLGGQSSGFFASFLPNRTQVKGIAVDQVGFVWKGAEQSAEARGIGVRIKPSEGHEFYTASASGGTVDLSLLRDTPVKLRNMEATLQGSDLTIEELRAEAAGADISAEGSITLGDSAMLDITGNVSGLDLERIEPEDWVKSLHGKIGGELKVSGDPREFSKLAWRGNARIRDGMLEGLPILHVIARKTSNDSFLRLVLKDARTDFTRTSDGGWLVEKLTLDAPGLLRLKGNATAAPDRTLRGDFILGIVPGTLKYVPGAEQEVFVPLNRLLVTQRERALITNDDSGLLWTRLKLTGTLDKPEEDLADRLAHAWFNATVDEVMNMSVEGAAKAAQAAGKLASEAAGQVLEKAPDILQNGLKTGTDLLQKGVEGGLKTIEGLIPR